MTHAIEQCPTDDQLSALACGGVKGPQLDALEAHLDRCVACRQLLAAVSNGSTPAMRPTDRPTLRPGEVLGRYEIERLIGAGGMGMLYVARDPQLGRRVALKLMRPSLAAEGGRLRLLREAQSMAQLSHPNVVSVFDLGEVEGRVFVAMELLEGGTLREWMRAPRSWKEVVAMYCEAGEGLAAAHAAGVVHRDFKPENVMMGKDQRPKVGDFGLARPELVAEEEPPLAMSLALKMTHAGAMMGTPAYMSPEQLAGQPADAKSDQYGFCVSLYEALAGQRPFPADSLEELRARVSGGMPTPPKDGLVPAHVWAAIARGLNPDPAERFADMQALLLVLRFPFRDETPAVRRSRRWREAISVGALAGVAVLLAVVASSASLRLGARGEPAASPPQATPATPEASPGESKYQLWLPLFAQKVISVPNIQRVVVADAAVVEAHTLGEQQVLLTAKSAGSTEVLVRKTSGEQLTYHVTVEAPAGSIISINIGMQKVITVKDLERVAIGDSEVANVTVLGDTQLLIVGKTPGKTTLLVWRKGGERQSYLLSVPPPDTVGELKQALGPMQGVTIRQVGDLVILDGVTLSKADAERVAKVAALFPNVKNLTTGAQP
jgi:eukaryotic-like serine/threonine-protein kinase